VSDLSSQEHRSAAATPQVISPELWAPDSPDLNLVDYCIWGWMQEHVYRTPVRDIDELNQTLIDTWYRIPQSIIDKAIDQRQTRLRACVKAKGCHFDHLL